MDISLLRAHELTGEQINAWRSLLRDSEFDNPFYAPTFTQAIAQFRDDVEVAVVQQNGDDVGFFPFQRTVKHVGRPVGWKINDFQGAVVAPNVQVDPREILRQCRLAVWRFDHLPLSQSWCSEAHIICADSPYIDVEQGYDTYLTTKFANGSSRLKTLARKARKLQRENGPLRFEFNCTDPAVFARLLDWKSQQLQQMNTYNVLAENWVQDSLQYLRESDDPDCAGVLSAIWSGDSLVAAHFGIRSASVLHWWFTAYNAAFNQYSPGAILLLKLIEHCSGTTLKRIDLGKGMESYKQSFLSGVTPLAEGAIARTAWRQTQQRVVYRLVRSVRTSTWMYPAVKWIKKAKRVLVNNQTTNHVSKVFDDTTQSAT